MRLMKRKDGIELRCLGLPPANPVSSSLVGSSMVVHSSCRCWVTARTCSRSRAQRASFMNLCSTSRAADVGRTFTQRSSWPYSALLISGREYLSFPNRRRVHDLIFTRTVSMTSPNVSRYTSRKTRMALQRHIIASPTTQRHRILYVLCPPRS
jgi:hypothetical protein